MIEKKEITHRIDGITKDHISKFPSFGLNLDDECCFQVVRQYIRDKYPDKDTYISNLQHENTLMDALIENTKITLISKEKIEDESYNYTVSMEYDSVMYDEIIINYETPLK